MKILLVIFIFAIGLSGVRAQTAQKTEPESKLIEFHMALLKPGSKPSVANEEQQKHVEYVKSLIESGQAVIAGPVKDNPQLLGVYIFRAKSAEEARAWAEADQIVASGHATAEMHPWWSEDVMKKPATPLRLETAYLAFLTRGEKWTPEK